jgi:uncharacterized protein YkwD
VAALILVGEAQPAPVTHAESSLLTAMNEVRLAHHARPLHADPRLERAARAHSSKMLRTGLFFHGAFDARIRSVGVRAPRIGENLAWAVGRLTQARAVVRMWMASPEHRRNLLDPGFSIVGVGALRGTFSGRPGTLIVTTDFAGG